MEGIALPPKKKSNTQFLSGDGEMRRLVREFNWSESPLGPIESWPPCLKTTLGILLNSAFPMFLFWGKDLICFYNDAYRPSLGNNGKHPAIGKGGREVWPDIWGFIGPLIDKVMTTGQAVWFEDQFLPIYRNGKMEDVYWTFSYSPAYNDDGDINGTFVTCTETTSKFLSQKQLQENKDRLHFAIEAAELGAWEYNPATNKFSANHRFKEWFGLGSEDNILLEVALAVVKPEDRQRVSNAMQRALQYDSGGFFNVTYTIVNPHTNLERVLSAKGKAWFNDQKAAYRFNGTLQDITELRKSEEDKQNLIAVIEASQDIIGLANADTSIVYGNPAALKMLGWEDVKNKQILDCLYPDDIPRAQKVLSELVINGSSRQEIRFVNKKTGVPFWIEWNAVTITDPLTGKVSGLATVSPNITERKKSEQHLKESEQRFQAAVAAVEGVLWTNNAKGEMEGEQPGWSSLTGQRYHEYQGHGWASVVHPEDVKTTVDAWNEAVMKKKIFTFQHRLRTKNDEWRHFSIRAIPLQNPDGTVREWVGVHTDITEQILSAQAIRESEERFRSLADQSPMIVYIVEPDEDANISYFNKTWLNYTGQTFEQALGRAWDEIVHPEDVQSVLDVYVPAFRKREAYTLPAIRLRRHDGEYRWFLFKGTPRHLPNGEFIGFVGVGIDIHDQKLMEFELKKSEETLEELVRERTSQLERSNEDLQQFAHVASHDLKEPVRKVKTFTNRIKEEASDRLTEKEQGYIEKVQGAASRMSSMIDGVLLYSTVNSAQVNIEAVDLEKVFDDIQNDLEIFISQKSAVIHRDPLPVIEGAGVLIHQLFYNLMNNSLKFSKQGQVPVISVTSKNLNISGADYVRIELNDNGIGFEPAHARMIFNTFTRLNSKDRFEGTGLGLALCKKIVMRHRGSIEATGKPDKGATFMIMLPLKQKKPTI